MYPTPERCRPYLREIAQLQARLDDPNPDWLISDAQAVRSSVVAVTTAMMTRMLGPEPDHSNDTETIRARAHYAAAAVSAIAYAQDPHFAGIMAEHWLLSREGKTAILARSLAHLWGEVTSDLPDGSCNGSLLMGIPPGHHGKSMRETLAETHLKRMDDAPFALASAMALGYLVDLSEWQLSKPQQQALLESDLLKEILPRQLVQSARPYLWVRHPQDDHQGRYGVLPEKPGPGWSTSTYRQDLAPDAYIASRSGLAPEQRNRMLPIAPPEFLHLAEHRDRLRSQEDMPAAIQGHAGIARFVARAMDAAGFGIRFEDAGALDPCCDWGNRTIHMPPLERFDTQADYLAALLHEIGHAVGHERISALAYDLHGLSPQIRLQEECAADGFLLAFAREHPEIPVDLALFSFDQAKGTRWAYPITPEEVIRAAYRVGEDAYRRIEAGEPLAIWRYSDKVLSTTADNDRPPATAPPASTPAGLFQAAMERLEQDVTTLLHDPVFTRQPGAPANNQTRAHQMAIVARMLPRMDTLDRLHQRAIRAGVPMPLEWKERYRYFTELRAAWSSAGLVEGKDFHPPAPPRTVMSAQSQIKGRKP